MLLFFLRVPKVCGGGTTSGARSAAQRLGAPGGEPRKDRASPALAMIQVEPKRPADAGGKASKKASKKASRMTVSKRGGPQPLELISLFRQHGPRKKKIIPPNVPWRDSPGCQAPHHASPISAAKSDRPACGGDTSSVASTTASRFRMARRVVEWPGGGAYTAAEVFQVSQTNA